MGDIVINLTTNKNIAAKIYSSDNEGDNKNNN